MTYTDAQIAQVCHEANRTLQTLHVTMGDKSVPVSQPWWRLTDPERELSIAGVRAAIDGQTPEQLHDTWCEHRRAHGWTYGPVKNEVEQTHPCLVPYDQLPTEQRRKDHLFAAIVRVLVGAIDAAEVIERWDREAAAEDSGPQLADNAALEPMRAVLQQRDVRIGYQVHYVSEGSPVRDDGTQKYPSLCRAALVTEVSPILYGGEVGLFVANPTGTFHNQHVPFDAGTCSRPAREATPGERLPVITCADLEFRPGTWHRILGA